MFKFFAKLKRHFFSSQRLLFWVFGGILIGQIVFNFLWIDWPLNLIISIGLFIFYLIMAVVLIENVDKIYRLDVERNQINAIISSIDDQLFLYPEF